MRGSRGRIDIGPMTATSSIGNRETKPSRAISSPPTPEKLIGPSSAVLSAAISLAPSASPECSPATTNIFKTREPSDSVVASATPIHRGDEQPEFVGQSNSAPFNSKIGRTTNFDDAGEFGLACGDDNGFVDRMRGTERGDTLAARLFGEIRRLVR